LKTDFIKVVAGQKCDTPVAPGAGNAGLLPSDNWGYLAGHNGYGDLAKANHFTQTAPYQVITGALLRFGAAYDATGQSQVEIVVWDDSGLAGGPGQQLASQRLSLQQVSSDIGDSAYSYVLFNPPVHVSSDFYLGLRLNYAQGDTVALMTFSPPPAWHSKGWEQWADSLWMVYDFSIGQSLMHACFPITCRMPAKVEGSTRSPGRLLFPNPAAGKVWLQLGQAAPAGFSVTLYDLPGRLVMQRTCIGRMADGYGVLDVSPLPAGVYVLVGRGLGSREAVRELLVVK